MSLTFKPTSYLRPKTEEELSDLLKNFGERAKIIAGGTGIYEVAHRGLLAEIDVLIDISGLDLSYVSVESESLKIGATTTMSAMARSSELGSRRQFCGIFDALTAIQPLQVKNVATIGGAICTALPFFDLPVSLLSLDAAVRIGPSNSRKKLSEFLLGYFVAALEQGEFVEEIELTLASNRASAFQKFGLTHDDWALINCGVSLSLDGSRIVGPVIVFGGGVG
ncbi:MAG: FAD binding domain-containing protein, partial [Nitrososphaerales archaeon]